MGALILLILVAIALLVFLIFILRSLSAGGKKNQLWNKCRQLLKLPPAEADKTIERYMENLKSKHPGHSEEWYLEKIIYDLERDR